MKDVIKHVLSDLDGVVRHFPKERDLHIEAKYGLPPGTMARAAFEKSLLTKAITGLITDEQWRSEIAKSLIGSFPQQTVEAAVKEWSASPGQVDWEYLDSLGRNFPGVPISVLTNATSRLEADLERLRLQQRFFRVFNSSFIGFCKPAEEVYHYVIESLGSAASEILFIDDSRSHVNAAQNLGMIAIHYTSLSDLEADIQFQGLARPNDC